MRASCVLVLLGTVFLAVGGCAGTHHVSKRPITTNVSSSTTLAPLPLMGWHGQPLTPPINADDGALVITTGSPPRAVSPSDALALARHVLGDQDWPRTTTQTLRGRATLSPAKAQLGPGVAQLTNQPAWIVAYQSQIAYSCPATDSTPAIPATASQLDALIITGAAIDQVTIYHGAGTGPCVPRLYPLAQSATRL